MNSNQHARLQLQAGVAGRANAVLSRQRALAAYHAKPNICKECSTPILVREGEQVCRVRKRKFCSQRCGALNSNRHHPKRVYEGRCRSCQTPVPTIWVYCEGCRPKHLRSRTHPCKACRTAFKGPNRYCSPECVPSSRDNAASRRATYIAAWLAGDVSGGTINHGVSGHVRHYLFEKHGAKCCKCGWSRVNPVTERVPLHVDHIDGDWRNHSEGNLQLLCPNCHALTPTYGALNKGRGRPDRRNKSDRAGFGRSQP